MFRIDLPRTRRRRGRAAWSCCAHVRPCAGGKLPARRLAPLQCRGHFAEREIEHVVQQEGSPLERRQPVERQEQRDGQILGQLRAAVGRERCRVDNRLRQPGTDVLLAPCARRGQHVETNSRRRGHEKRSRVRHFVAVGRMPAQVRLLHRVLGVGHRPEHAVGETEQAPAVRLEARGRIRHRARGAHAVRTASGGAAGSGQSQPTEGHGDQPQHQGPGATDYSVAGAGTTVGDGQIQPAVDHGD